MASIMAPGVGSGLDINGLVDKLVAAEREPAELRLANRESRYQAEISAYGGVKSALEQFRTTLSPLSRASTFDTLTATSSDPGILGARAGSTAAAGNYRISVDALAQTHTLVMNGVDDLNAVIGSGTLTFRSGTTDYDTGTDTYNGFTLNPNTATRTLTVDSSNNTLSGLRDAINAADLGVHAGIIYDGSQYRLTLSAVDSGAANSLQIEVNDADGDHTDLNGLSRLAFNASATNLEQTVAAQDARLGINGLAVTSASNSVSGAIGGVTLDLKQLSAGQVVNLDIARDTGATRDAVQSFVTGYNELLTAVKDVSSYDPTTRKGGTLTGDAALRGLVNNIRATLNQEMPGLNGPFGALADIGVTTARDGTLTIDAARLDAALARDPEAVGRLFSVSGSSTSTNLRYAGASATTQPGDYAVEVTRQATQGSYTGSAFGYGGSIAVDAANDNLSLRIDGVSTAPLTLTHGTYTGAQLAAELQTRINGDANLRAAGVAVNVAFDTDTNRFVIGSTRYGSASSVEITGMDSSSAATLGLNTGAGVTGEDVAGSIGGVPATGSGRTLIGTGAAQGLRTEVSGTGIGMLGSLSFSRGVGDRLNNLVIDMLADDSSINGRIAGIESRIGDIDGQRETLARRMDALEARLRAEFTAMDLLVGQLKATGSYLEQQLENLPTIGGTKKR
ncbi:MAG: flagellar filament capping protein FliD [Thiohalobacteraceae bacterium]